MNNFYADPFECKYGLQLTDVSHTHEYIRDMTINEYHYNVNSNYNDDTTFQEAFDDLMWLSNLKFFRLYFIRTPILTNINYLRTPIQEKTYMGVNVRYTFNFT